MPTFFSEYGRLILISFGTCLFGLLFLVVSASAWRELGMYGVAYYSCGALAVLGGAVLPFVWARQWLQWRRLLAETNA
ncbi:MAG: hypothetical protein R3F39_14605 [Myxococcota bacterium]